MLNKLIMRINSIYPFSSDKMASLYEDLRTSDAPPHLVSQFEEVLSSLVADVKNMENETKRMEERMAK